MSGLTLFGLAAVISMVVFYAFEERSRLCLLGFAVSCVLGSIYGFLQGAWPFGAVEIVWSAIAVRRYLSRKPHLPPPPPPPQQRVEILVD